MEDKLDHEERLRLECLAQAIAARNVTESPDQTVKRAAEFEKYVRSGS
jgi:hypothetical protein